MDKKSLLFLVQKYPHLFDYIVNIYLVHKNARKSCLIEGYNLLNIYGDNEKTKFQKDLDIIFDLVSTLNLQIYTESEHYYRYLVGSASTIKKFIHQTKRTDNYEMLLGKTLGFICAGHSFSDQSIERTVLDITIKYNTIDKPWSESHFVQVCETKLISEQELQKHAFVIQNKYEKVLPKEFNIVVEIINVSDNRSRAEEIVNYEYVKENLGQFVDDIANYWCMDSHLANLFKESLKSKKEYENYLPLYRYVWNEFVINDIASTLDEDPPTVELSMQKFDRELFDYVKEHELSSGIEILDALKTLWWVKYN